MDIKALRQTVDKLFTRARLMLTWQEIAENFYPERADFTVRRQMGDNYADYLMTSYPVQCRRDLGDQIGTMLRPSAKPWFHMSLTDEDREDNDAERWLEHAEGVQRRAMYDRVSKFTRATKEADNDFAAFGQCVVSVRLNKNHDALLYRCHHLRDVVWQENEDGDICLIARKWKPFARELVRLFPGEVHPSVTNTATRDPFAEIECVHIVCEADMYDGNAKGMPYWSIYYDLKHSKILEAMPVRDMEYVIPRWQTVSGSQYAYSPATIVALPDARVIQAMTYTLLEAGEKLVNPPLIATHDVLRSDANTYPGGLTIVDQDYDERLGESLRPLKQDIGGMPLGLDMQQDARAMIQQAFYLNKLNLPQRGPDMTAYEIGQRVQEYIRGALPIFEPMEADYNGQICERTFDLMLRAGAFGSPFDMPQSLQGAEIHFKFASPLHDIIEQQKGHQFMEMQGILAQALQMDQTVGVIPDFQVAVRDVLDGIGIPAKWLRSETTAQQIQAQQQAALQSQQTLAAMETGSKVAGNLAGAQKDLSDSQGSAQESSKLSLTG